MVSSTLAILLKLVVTGHYMKASLRKEKCGDKVI